MDIRIAKRIINEKVAWKGNTYLLNACILRREQKKDGHWYYQAELKELKANCVIITKLDEVEELKGETEQ